MTIELTPEEKAQRTTLIIAIISIVLIIAALITLYCTGHIHLAVFIAAGILGGFVNYYYVFLNLPTEKPADPKGTKGIAAPGDSGDVWEQPHKTYWLAFLGYMITGLVGALLTPLINQIVTLKGYDDKNPWILLGYAIIFAFGANRLLSSILGNILNKITALETEVKKTNDKLTQPNPNQITTPTPNPNPIGTTPSTPTVARSIYALRSPLPTDYNQLLNLPAPDLDTNFVKGIDISHYNGAIFDWQSLVNDGVKFAYIKTSDGVGTPDQMAQTNALLAQQNGLKIGYFHFGRPDTRNGGTVEADATAEAQEFSNILKTLPNADLPPVLDLEDVPAEGWDTPLNPDEYLTWINTFMTELALNTQSNVQIIYSRKEYIEPKLPAVQDLASRYMLWLSRYSNDYNQADTINNWDKWVIWQFTDKGTISASSAMDLDLMRRDTFNFLTGSSRSIGKKGITTRRAHVLERTNGQVEKRLNAGLKERMPSLLPMGGGDYPNAILRGATPNYQVYYDVSLGNNGPAIADGVIAKCEADLAVLKTQFGGISAGPFKVIIAANIGGAYHYGCSATDIYCEGDATGATPNVDLSCAVLAAEVIEVFSSVQGRGWDCGSSNGEGLSRILSAEIYPVILRGFQTAKSWLDTADRPDFVNTNDPSDTNPISNGCSVLFINYLHYQLGYSWEDIVAAGAPTLAQTYNLLTKNNDGFEAFKNLLQAHFPVGVPATINGDNVFPL